MSDDRLTNDAVQQERPLNQTEADIAAARAAWDPQKAMHEAVLSAIKTCYDPEIPVDIWELGLIYRVDVDEHGNVQVDMTLTSPMCPVAGELPVQVQQAILGVDDVISCQVEVVWDPPWRQDMMSEVARVQLDMF